MKLKKTDGSHEYKGFDLTWHTNCGGNIFSDKEGGTFASGNYPMPYHAHSHCYWTIRTTPDLAYEKALCD